MKLSRAAALLAAVAACSLAVAPAALGRPSAERHHDDDGEAVPLVTGHRGAPGYLPDHTLEGYKLAIDMGADYIEPDLVATKDGVPDRPPRAEHRRHDRRRRTQVPRAQADGVVDGGGLEDDWFASDFTLKEIKTLRAVQPLARRPPDGVRRPVQDPDVRRGARAGQARGPQARPAGRRLPGDEAPDLPPAARPPARAAKLVDALRRAGLNRKGAPVIIQSFEQSNLRYLDRITPVTLAQLVDAWDVEPRRQPRRTPTTSLRPVRLDRVGRSGADEPDVRRTSPRTPASTRSPSTRTSSRRGSRTSSRPTGTDANGDGDADDVTGDGDGRRARPRARAADLADPPRPPARPRRPHVDVPQRGRTGSPPTTTAIRSPSTSCSTRSASTACSRTSRTPRVAARDEFFAGVHQVNVAAHTAPSATVPTTSHVT